MVKLPDNLIKVAESRTPEVLLAPGGFFFSRLVSLPPELTPEEFPGLAELTLEECSPFPLEQLAWGFLVDHDRRELWLFAACRPRIGSSAMEDWDEAEHVFPAFLPLLLAMPQPPERLLWQSEDEILLLDFKPGARFPHRIRHQRLPQVDEGADESESTDVDSLTSGFLRAEGVDADGATIYELKETNVSDDRVVSFVVGPQEGEPLPEVTLSDSEATWWADLRSVEFIEEEKKSRRWQNTLWASLQWASWAAVCLVLLVLLNIVGDMLVKRRAALIVAQQPAVTAIEQNRDFLDDLRQFSQRPLRPYEVLGLTNEYRPYKQIEYTSAEIDSTDGIIIQGNANSANEANAFNDTLLRTNFFRNLDPVVTKRDSRTGLNEFKFHLEYIGPMEDDGESMALNENQEVEQ